MDRILNYMKKISENKKENMKNIAGKKYKYDEMLKEIKKLNLPDEKMKNLLKILKENFN